MSSSVLDSYHISVRTPFIVRAAIVLEIIANCLFLAFAAPATETFLQWFIVKKSHHYINPVATQFFKWWLSMIILLTLLLILSYPNQYSKSSAYNLYNISIITIRKLTYLSLLLGEVCTTALLFYFVYTVNHGEFTIANLILLNSLVGIAVWRIYCLFINPAILGRANFDSISKKPQ
jgi:hypothetical protein